MSIVKPYTFVAGNKARANEVNADFDLLYQQVNTNITDIAQNATDITNMGNSKADINGSALQRFAVADPVGNSDAVNKRYMLENGLPTGFILYAGFETVPNGYLICDGSAISRTTYAALFSAIGTTFGAGDESTTFNLPDLISNPYIKASTTVGIKVDAKAPNISGGCNTGVYWSNNGYGALYSAMGTRNWKYGGTGTDGVMGTTIDASRCSSVYKNDATTIEPKSLTLLPIIKY